MRQVGTFLGIDRESKAKLNLSLWNHLFIATLPQPRDQIGRFGKGNSLDGHKTGDFESILVAILPKISRAEQFIDGV